MTASVTILSKIKPPLRWEPMHLEATEGFLKRKSQDANGPSYDDLAKGEHSVVREAQRILGRCLPPTDAAGRETGLVVGYVQSGKTLSFETVIALARDNNYGMVILFAGTKTNLREQSEGRLTEDLGIDDGENWHHFSNPTKANQIEDKLEAWRKQPTRRAILVTVLKQVDHLGNLATVLKKLPLVGVPVLIVDDESDQASLNTQAARIRAARAAANARSTTYDRILVVREMVPHHTFLQYTATPQANLLLAQTDLLNPSFAELVTPGSAYTGGKAFFEENSGLVIDIPTREVPSKTNNVRSIPKTLLSALRCFLLVSAQHAITFVRGSKDRNRSMMVHPAMQTSSHKVYKAWVDKSLRALTSFVERQFQKMPSEVEARFQVEYNSLKATYADLKPLPELIKSMMDEVFGEMNCVEVNGTPDAEKNVNFKRIRYWILVGGAKLDRGYTVEGLAITYMPRPLGGSPAADTLQQRARFFGYKKAYLGLCRVFVQNDVREAFANYVDHEEFVRYALVKHRGKPLSAWRRDFLLDPLLRPTRPNVIGLSTRRIPVDGWLVPDVLHRGADAAELNRRLLTKVDQSWKDRFGPAVKAAEFPQFKDSKDISPNFVLEAVPLRVVVEEFLLNVQVRDPADAEEHSAMLIAMAELLRENDSLKTDIYLMNNLIPQYRTRDAGRGFPAGHQNAPINQYFSNSADAVNDRSFLSTARVSLQLRRFNLGKTAREASSADILNVTWFVVNVPSLLRKDLHIEGRS